MKRWHVYLLECADKSLYTGITNDLKRRLAAHRSGRGARYTRAFGAMRLLWKERHPDRSSASRREAQIKRLSRAQKISLIRCR